MVRFAFLNPFLLISLQKFVIVIFVDKLEVIKKKTRKLKPAQVKKTSS